jgi:hypothetical protein
MSENLIGGHCKPLPKEPGGVDEHGPLLDIVGSVLNVFKIGDEMDKEGEVPAVLYDAVCSHCKNRCNQDLFSVGNLRAHEYRCAGCNKTCRCTNFLRCSGAAKVQALWDEALCCQCESAIERSISLDGNSKDHSSPEHHHPDEVLCTPCESVPEHSTSADSNSKDTREGFFGPSKAQPLPCHPGKPTGPDGWSVLAHLFLPPGIEEAAVVTPLKTRALVHAPEMSEVGKCSQPQASGLNTARELNSPRLPRQTPLSMMKASALAGDIELYPDTHQTVTDNYEESLLSAVKELCTGENEPPSDANHAHFSETVQPDGWSILAHLFLPPGLEEAAGVTPLKTRVQAPSSHLGSPPLTARGNGAEMYADTHKLRRRSHSLERRCHYERWTDKSAPPLSADYSRETSLPLSTMPVELPSSADHARFSGTVQALKNAMRTTSPVTRVPAEVAAGASTTDLEAWQYMREALLAWPGPERANIDKYRAMICHEAWLKRWIKACGGDMIWVLSLLALLVQKCKC